MAIMQSGQDKVIVIQFQGAVRITAKQPDVVEPPPGPSYIDLVLATQSQNMLAYWPLNETAGTTAIDQIDSPNQDGTYSNVTLNDTPGPDGSPAPLYNGTNSVTNIYSTTFRDVFNGSEGTVMIWIKVLNAGVWTDGKQTYCINLQVNSSNNIGVYKIAAPNLLRFNFAAGGITFAYNHTTSTPDWFCATITWSISSDTVNYYIDGNLINTRTGIGTWVGDLLPTNTVVGALNTTPVQPWNGWLSHSVVWNQALVDPQIKELYDQSPLAYKDTLLNTANANLLAIWLLDETSGTNAANYEGTAARDGTYVDAILNDGDGPDGEPTISLNGSTGRVSIHSSSFESVFNGQEGCLSIWVKPTDWAVGGTEFIIRFRGDSSNEATLYKTNNNITFQYKAAGNDKRITRSVATIEWVHLCLTWSLAADAVYAYINGVQVGTEATLGTWSISTLLEGTTQIGAANNANGSVYSGNLGRSSVWSKPLNSREINYHWYNALQSPTYAQSLQTLQPDNLLAIWPLSETSGTDALDSTPHSRNGTHSNVTLNDTTAPDGSPAPLYNGTNSVTNIYSTSFRDAFNGSEGTVMIWARVLNAGVWTDGSFRNTVFLRADAPNTFTIDRTSTDNTLRFYYSAGGVVNSLNHITSTTDWMHLSFTWSKSGNIARFYFNGNLIDTRTGLGTWVGNLSSTNTVLGGSSTTGSQSWSGWLSHPIVHSKALQPSEIKYAYQQATA